MHDLGNNLLTARALPAAAIWVIERTSAGLAALVRKNMMILTHGEMQASKEASNIRAKVSDNARDDVPPTCTSRSTRAAAVRHFKDDRIGVMMEPALACRQPLTGRTVQGRESRT